MLPARGLPPIGEVDLWSAIQELISITQCSLIQGIETLLQVVGKVLDKGFHVRSKQDGDAIHQIGRNDLPQRSAAARFHIYEDRNIAPVVGDWNPVLIPNVVRFDSRIRSFYRLRGSFARN